MPTSIGCSEPMELIEIGFADLAEDAVVLVEWPERAGGLLPADRLEIEFALAPDAGAGPAAGAHYRHGALAARVARIDGDQSLSRRRRDSATPSACACRAMPRPASTSALTLEDRRAILMNAPRRPDGPPMRNGLPYSAIAHLAEDVKPFVALARALRERGFSAPEIHAADLDRGLLVLEDLGDRVRGRRRSAAADRRALYGGARCAGRAASRDAAGEAAGRARASSTSSPRYDLDALMIEVELLLDWYLPHAEAPRRRRARAEFADAVARGAADRPRTRRPTWVLRDYHSPNLLWLPERKGIARVGVLDFQDALIGPAAYDVVSLLQDARVDVPETIEDAPGQPLREGAAAPPTATSISRSSSSSTR